MNKLDRQILQLLGKMDAIFAPYRAATAGEGQPAGIREARNRFFASGMPLRGGGGNRQAFSRQLDELQAMNLITMRRERGSRWPIVRLTEVAEARPQLGRSPRPGLRLRDPPEGGQPGAARCAGMGAGVSAFRLGWNRDAAVGSPEWHEFVLTQDMALPALCRGWLETRLTTRWYCCLRVGPHCAPTPWRPPSRQPTPIFTSRAPATFTWQRTRAIAIRC